MIAFLSGRIAEKTATHAVLEVAGVGYLLAMPTGSLVSLPAEGDSVTIHTYLHVREDELSLYGFESHAERELFRKLITVSGVGPKVALAALSSFAPDVLVGAITGEDVAIVSSIPGVGKKTASRIILDLKDKFVGAVPGAGASSAPGAGSVAEARDALLSMGFSSAEVLNAIKGYSGPDADTQALLRHALKRLGSGA
ncbi:MAG: Holliday junction branch migration protein RuvA [Coriobacteriia bacterium]|nr:Holliday junction branch migration protein RuvA [Coriobacteriia bacterium]